MLSGDNFFKLKTNSFNATQETQVNTPGGLNASLAAINSSFLNMTSNFESEAHAMAYAQELQHFYDSQNLELKVQIETNLRDLDDTATDEQIQKDPNNIFSSGTTNYMTPQHMTLKERSHSVQAHNSVKNAYSKHFKKIQPTKRRFLQSSEQNQRKIAKPKFGFISKVPKKDQEELLLAQERIYGVISQPKV